MLKPLPAVALIVPPGVSAFHFAVPYTVFTLALPEGPLFDLKVVTSGARALRAERALMVLPDGGLELTETADIVVVPSWHDLSAPPEPDLLDALSRAHARGAHVVGLCYGAYALAYAGLLDGKRAATHWMAEQDFCVRFPRVKLDMNALYVEEDRLITSAGTGAGLDCVDDLAAQTAMSRRTFTRHFSKATSMTLVEWLVNERLQRARELLETTSLPVEKIAELVGFQTPVSLRQHFRKRFQVSPRDWRRTFGQGEAIRA